MNILIDIGHPAHVHYYRNLSSELTNHGHKVIWTVKNIPVALRLLDYYGFKYHVFPEKSDSIIGKAYKQLQYNVRLLRICRREKIDIAIGTSVSIAHVSKISHVNSVVFDDDDDEVQPLVTKFVNPFADALLSPESLREKRRRKDTIFYPGFHELAYLHPKRFTPDSDVLKHVGLAPDDTYFIMRFNVFKAHHDIGINGLTLVQKLELISMLKPYGKIFITTERSIEPELQEYHLDISPDKIHSLMAYASLFLGDSQTMTSEAAILGIPAVKCNSFAGLLSVPNELELKYQLCFSYLTTEFNKMKNKVLELLSIADLKKQWQIRRDKMLNDKIDVTAFWVWFIENYPTSAKFMKENSNYPYNFK